MLEKLKNNLAKFGTLSKEEKEFFKNTAMSDCIVLSPLGEWVQVNDSDIFFHDDCRYRIKPDYQEPKKLSEEYIEIKISNTHYPEYYVVIDGRLFKLYEIIYMPMFSGFYFKHNNTIWQNINYWDINTKMKCNQKCYVKISR